MKKVLFYSVTLLLGANLLAQNVGIGTNTPDASAKLDVVDSNRGVLIPRVALTSTLVAAPVATPANSLLVFNTNTAGDVTPGYYYWDSGLNRWVRLLTTQSNDWMLDGNNNGVLRTIGTNDNFDFPIETNGTEKMRVTTAGNVGIATTVPGARLDVVGPATGTGITIRAAGGGDVVLNSGGSLFFDGNYSYATGNYIRPIAANTQTFVTSGAERMRITPVGNVGIGTAAPTQRLHVSGGSILTDRSYAASTLDLAAAAAINIAQPATQVRITNVVGAQANAVTYSATAIEGQYLWISNTDDNAATFAGATIPSNTAMGFVYTGGAWRAVRSLGAGDDWTILGNAGTNETVNFIGTTDAQGLTVRTNNLERFRFSGSAFQLLSITNGTAALPSYSWNGDNTSGMYRPVVNSVGFSVASAERLRITSTPQILSVGTGTAAAPAWSWLNDTNLGIFSPATDQIAVSTNGIERMRILDTGRGRYNTTGTGIATDVFAVYGNNVPGATAALGNWVISAYVQGGGVGVYGESNTTGSTTACYGVFGNVNGANTPTGVNSIGVLGQNTTVPLGTGYAIGVWGFTNSTSGNAIGLFGSSASPNGFGIRAHNSNPNGTGGVFTGNNVNGTYLISGSGIATTGSTLGGLGYATTAASGIGLIGVGNNSASIYAPAQGGGVVGTGQRYGVIGFALMTNNTNPLNNNASNGVNASAGGYFEVQNGGTPITWSYVAVRDNGGVNRKIIGPGTVNTIVPDLNGNLVTMSCPEAPENLFTDFGTGQLVNGKAHIDLDPIFSKNIVVDAKHPLRVFIQLEGNCKGVYVTNKTQKGFDVIELENGNSNVPFTWSVVANRADEINPDGSIAKYSSERFVPAPLPIEKRVLKTQTVEPLDASKLPISKEKMNSK